MNDTDELNSPAELTESADLPDPGPGPVAIDRPRKRGRPPGSRNKVPRAPAILPSGRSGRSNNFGKAQLDPAAGINGVAGGLGPPIVAPAFRFADDERSKPTDFFNWWEELVRLQPESASRCVVYLYRQWPVIRIPKTDASGNPNPSYIDKYDGLSPVNMHKITLKHGSGDYMLVFNDQLYKSATGKSTLCRCFCSVRDMNNHPPVIPSMADHVVWDDPLNKSYIEHLIYARAHVPGSGIPDLETRREPESGDWNQQQQQQQGEDDDMANEVMSELVRDLVDRTGNNGTGETLTATVTGIANMYENIAKTQQEMNRAMIEDIRRQANPMEVMKQAMEMWQAFKPTTAVQAAPATDPALVGVLQGITGTLESLGKGMVAISERLSRMESAPAANPAPAPAQTLDTLLDQIAKLEQLKTALGGGKDTGGDDGAGVGAPNLMDAVVGAASKTGGKMGIPELVVAALPYLPTILQSFQAMTQQPPQAQGMGAGVGMSMPMQGQGMGMPQGNPYAPNPYPYGSPGGPPPVYPMPSQGQPQGMPMPGQPQPQQPMMNSMGMNTQGGVNNPMFDDMQAKAILAMPDVQAQLAVIKDPLLEVWRDSLTTFPPTPDAGRDFAGYIYDTYGSAGYNQLAALGAGVLSLVIGGYPPIGAVVMADRARWDAFVMGFLMGPVFEDEEAVEGDPAAGTEQAKVKTGEDEEEVKTVKAEVM